MNKEFGIKRIIFLALAIFIVGGMGGVVFERSILPYLSTWPLLKHFSLFNPQAPIVITKREEIRINEGINYREVANRVKNALVTVYLHEGLFGTAKFRLGGVTTGMVMTSDGVVVIPAVNLRPETLITVILFNGEVHRGQLMATDSLTNLSFFKIEAKDLSVIRQGFSQELQVGERLLAVRLTEIPSDVSIYPLTLSGQSLVLSSLATVYDFNRLNAFLRTDLTLGSDYLGAAVVNKDAAMMGFVTQLGKEVVILRAEDLKLALDKFLDDQKIAWPTLKLSYQVLGENLASVLGLPKKNGILVKAASLPLRENDFVFAVDGQEISPRLDFQHLLLSKKSGGKVKLELFRGGVENEFELSL